MQIHRSTGPVGPERSSTELKAGHAKTKPKVQHLADRVNDLDIKFAETSTHEKLGHKHVITQGPIKNNPRA